MTETAVTTPPDATTSHLADEFRRVREQSLTLCQPLEIEDYGLQAMANTSPPKWHLAHTTWFFETFVLRPFFPGWREWNPLFEHLFNSYYNGVGTPFHRPDRGLLSRPTVAEVHRYRRATDEQVMALLDSPEGEHPEVRRRLEMGLHHEHQHQELLLTDLKYSFHANPLLPAYQRPATAPARRAASPLRWVAFPEGVYHIGADGEDFCFDNERPRHRRFLEPFELASRPVTNGEFLAFMADGGYRRPELWLSDGWDEIQSENRQAPLYWRHTEEGWRHFTLAGEVPVDPEAPVCHLSYYEADACARWADARLPTEAEWETAASGYPVAGNLLDSGLFHPAVNPTPGDGLVQLFGDVWEWTASAYGPYPGFRPAEGAIGEYNGKFMCNQMVLRGGSCVSDAAHIRATYRNFFYPPDRWQFTGLRLARSL